MTFPADSPPCVTQQPMKKTVDPQNHQTALECVLDSFVAATEPDIALFNDLVSCMRPRRARDSDTARHAIYSLCFVLEHREDYRVALRGALWRLLSERRRQSLYTDVGIFPNNGFFTEVTHRFVRSMLLPDLFDLCQLRDVIAKVFKRASDHVWVRDVGVGTWTDLLRALRFDEAPGEEGAREEPGAMPPLRPSWAKRCACCPTGLRRSALNPKCFGTIRRSTRSIHRSLPKTRKCWRISRASRRHAVWRRPRSLRTAAMPTPIRGTFARAVPTKRISWCCSTSAGKSATGFAGVPRIRARAFR
ncbi:hypothetical protein PSAC2689_90198 [Paraburkholderia sacchari]